MPANDFLTPSDVQNMNSSMLDVLRNMVAEAGAKWRLDFYTNRLLSKTEESYLRGLADEFMYVLGFGQQENPQAAPLFTTTDDPEVLQLIEDGVFSDVGQYQVAMTGEIKQGIAAPTSMFTALGYVFRGLAWLGVGYAAYNVSTSDPVTGNAVETTIDAAGEAASSTIKSFVWPLILILLIIVTVMFGRRFAR